MSRARIVEQVIHWCPVTDPVRCQCGHGHSGRTPGGRLSASEAMQWGWCDDRDCGCSALRRVIDLQGRTAEQAAAEGLPHITPRGAS